MADIVVTKVNDVYCQVRCERSVHREMSEYFTFEVPGAKFMPAVRNRVWDGKIRLLNQDGKLYYGLIPYINEFAKHSDYTAEFQVEGADNFSLQDAKEFVPSLGLPFEPRDYQLEAFTHAVRNRRSLLLSPTASGKSLIIYMLCRWYEKKTLIIVPTVSLVTQMTKDFQEYGFKGGVHGISAGVSKDSEELFTVSTWQSIAKQPKSWFEQFEVVIGDEAHLYKSKSLSGIMHKLTDCRYRFGLTGTLDGTQTNKLVLEGLFGAVKQVTRTKDLIDKKQLADFRIKCLFLQHDTEDFTAGVTYAEEVDYLNEKEERNNFIKNLVVSLEGNTLVLFQKILHGKELLRLIKEKAGDRKVLYVSGETDKFIREEIRMATERNEGVIVVASLGTMSTGVSIKRINNVVFTSPTKSQVRVLQSIGRGLRRGNGGDDCTLYDIADDLTKNKKRNYTLNHFVERIKIYNSEKFDYKVYRIKLPKSKGKLEF